MEDVQAEAKQGQVDGGDGQAEPRGAEAVAAWLASGEELVAYCERTGQSVWSLRKWRREHADRFGLQIKRRPGAKGARRSDASASMIPIQLVSPAASMTGSATIEVRLAGERSLVLPIEIDGLTVTRLISAVEAAR